MKKILLSLFTVWYCSGIFSQNFEWAYGITGGIEDIGRAIESDNAGNVYTTGSFAGSADFDLGPGTTTLSSAGSTDIFIHKTDSDGNLIWAKKIGGTGQDYGNDILVDNTGNIFVAGFFASTVDFDPGPSTFNLSSAGASDAFLLKLDNAGNLIWVVKFGSTGGEVIRDMTFDLSENIIISGYFTNTVDFDPGVGNALHTSTAVGSGFVVKLDPNSNYIWSYTVEGNATTENFAVAVNSNNDVICSGYYNVTGGSADFEPGPGVTSLTSVANADIYLLKLSSSGVFQDVVGIAGTGSDVIGDLAINSNDEIILGIFFTGTIDVDPSPAVQNFVCPSSYDIAIAKYDVALNFIWAKHLSNVNDDRCYAVSIDFNDDIYLGGFFAGTLDFDPGPGTFNLTGGGWVDAYLLKLDNNGNFISAFNVATSTGNNQVQDIEIASDNSIYLTGQYSGNADADPSAGTTLLISAGTGDYSYFVSKFSQCLPTSSLQTIATCNSYTWSTNGVTYMTSGIYNEVLTNLAGCDSVVTLNLTITNSTTGTDVVAVCDTYTWIDGNTYNTSNNTATHTLTNVAGCDSVVTLNLTITNSTTGTDVVAVCDTYTWIDGNTYNTSNNTATHTLTNVAGCDSVVTLNLTINSSYNQTENISICNSNSYTLPNGTVVNSNGNYFSNLTSISGCDSIIETVLTVIAPNITTSLSGITITANAFTPNYQWLDCNNAFQIIAGETSASFTPSVNGSYAVSVNEDGCIDTSACVTISDVGYDENIANNILVYPNPAHEIIYVKCDFQIDCLILYDASGRIIKKENAESIVAINELTPGIYLLEIIADEIHLTKQIKIK